MNRREALKQLALLTGGALSMSTVAGVMGGCTAQTSGDFAPQTLSNKQNQMLIVLTERIIPATDTPGAEAAKVNQFIDHMLTNWNTKDERKHFLEGLTHVDELSKKHFSNAFLDLDEDKQNNIMSKLQQEANNNSGSESDLDPFFDMLKEFTVVGYYTSEIGATQELNSDLIPGYYDGCLPYSEVGRAWS